MEVALDNLQEQAQCHYKRVCKELTALAISTEGVGEGQVTIEEHLELIQYMFITNAHLHAITTEEHQKQVLQQTQAPDDIHHHVMSHASKQSKFLFGDDTLEFIHHEETQDTQQQVHESTLCLHRQQKNSHGKSKFMESKKNFWSQQPTKPPNETGPGEKPTQFWEPSCPK
ncbi:hypothetical protein IWQ61_009824 [Dispira simplex]|nr:hypothetical protein IWQ61_009824 [Dispira simplex]